MSSAPVLHNTIFVMAHAPLASALRQCALHVFPDCGERVLALDVAADATPENTLRHAHAMLDGMHNSPGVLLMVDVLGATPANIALQLAQQRLHSAPALQILAGVNLPMLLRAHCYANHPLSNMRELALQGATGGIVAPAIADAAAAPIRQQHLTTAPDSSTYHHYASAMCLTATSESTP